MNKLPILSITFTVNFLTYICLKKIEMYPLLLSNKTKLILQRLLNIVQLLWTKVINIITLC